MLNRTQISIPNLVRVKVGAIGRVGIYARRNAFSEVACSIAKTSTPTS